ncbi:putative toxin-antitoxin system toxin component, PIN family [Candidatus Viridilinea mediisalina]|uniref:Putative toxin-antitoxin system toxin component, PIN family n=1 Tax=Candidatus Viridilinea mediisalina TaxID=2024553 RepID=A0A2A6REL9_9CHLR|nr:putative toxin-antitoxin system toxin component, PIN family [Candidatus Viridilinea mediisalina]
MKVVFDTGVLVSAALLPNSLPRQALECAYTDGMLLVSDSTLLELRDVLQRSRFQRYINDIERDEFLAGIIRHSIPTLVNVTITECRDVKDNKFLELAVSGQATCIVSSDTDLLVLHPFRGIPILNPRQFLNMLH